jgi:hypothetical protein
MSEILDGVWCDLVNVVDFIINVISYAFRPLL